MTSSSTTLMAQCVTGAPTHAVSRQGSARRTRSGAPRRPPRGMRAPCRYRLCSASCRTHRRRSARRQRGIPELFDPHPTGWAVHRNEAWLARPPELREARDRDTGERDAVPVERTHRAELQVARRAVTLAGAVPFPGTGTAAPEAHGTLTSIRGTGVVSPVRRSVWVMSVKSPMGVSPACRARPSNTPGAKRTPRPPSWLR